MVVLSLLQVILVKGQQTMAFVSQIQLIGCFCMYKDTQPCHHVCLWMLSCYSSRTAYSLQNYRFRHLTLYRKNLLNAHLIQLAIPFPLPEFCLVYRCPRVGMVLINDSWGKVSWGQLGRKEVSFHPLPVTSRMMVAIFHLWGRPA